MGAAAAWAVAGFSPVAPSRSIITVPCDTRSPTFTRMAVILPAAGEGTSFATENLFQGRFRYVGELARMGADIGVEDHHLAIRGVKRLSGAPVRAFDIRAGAALVVAALAADDETVIRDSHHLDRGYDSFVDKLSSIGVDVVRTGRSR